MSLGPGERRCDCGKPFTPERTAPFATQCIDHRQATAFLCGPGTCEHVWDGPWVQMDANAESVTCSKCGADAMTDSLWNLP